LPHVLGLGLAVRRRREPQPLSGPAGAHRIARPPRLLRVPRVHPRRRGAIPMSVDPRIAAFAGSHLLLLDPDLEPFDVVGLLRNLRPRLPVGDPLPGEGSARAYRMSRHSQLVGPFAVDPAMARALELPTDVTALVALARPRDREPVPPPAWL